MNRLLIIAALSLLLAGGCNEHSVGPPRDQGPTELVERLLWWSRLQEDPVVFFIPGETYDVPETRDLISNLRWDSAGASQHYLDSLEIDTAAATWFRTFLASQHIDVDLDGIQATSALAEIQALLSRCRIEYRLAYGDTAASDLSSRLLSWAQHQSPTKVLYAKYHVLVDREFVGFPSGPPVIYPYCVQNIAYLMRGLSMARKSALVNAITDTLNMSEMTQELAVLGTITISDSWYGDY